MEEILHTFEHAFFHTIVIVPFLFLAFIIIEFVEHKLKDKNSNFLSKHKKIGPLVGAILGIVPQCGFSVMVTNLYVSRIVTLGTLISVYLVTSDEMLIVLLAGNAPVNEILTILGIKFIIGISSGFVIDLILRKRNIKGNESFEICEKDNCHCSDNIILGAFKHTVKIFLFIFIASVIIDFIVHEFGEESLYNLFLGDTLFAPFITALVGFIPNCVASVVLTELYLADALTLGSVIAGLLTGTGVALLVLFRTNKNFFDNLKIIFMLYFIGVIAGLIINLF